MKLRHINLTLDDNYFYLNEDDRNLCDSFDFQCAFINDYITRNVRKLKYETKHDFVFLEILLSPHIQADKKVIPFPHDKAIDVYVPFDRQYYEREKDNPDCHFYLDMIREGIVTLNEFTPLPVEGIFAIMDEFVAGKCVNEWVYKKKRFKEHDLQIVLRCEFTRDYFQVRLIANSITKKEKLTEGIFLRTEPNPFAFSGLYSDIELVGDKLVLGRTLYNLFYMIKVDDLKAGIFSVSLFSDQFLIDRMEGIDYAETTVIPDDTYYLDISEFLKDLQSHDKK